MYENKLEDNNEESSVGEVARKYWRKFNRRCHKEILKKIRRKSEESIECTDQQRRKCSVSLFKIVMLNIRNT